LCQVIISQHFKVSQCIDLQWLLDHEDVGTTILQNVGNYMPSNKVTYLKRYEEFTAKYWQIAYVPLSLLF